MAEKRFAGVLAPAVTPFRRDLSPDPDRFARHAKWLLANGCTGLAAPQWVVKTPLAAVVVAVVTDYPNGKYQPAM